jgi:hypothetical protein
MMPAPVLNYDLLISWFLYIGLSGLVGIIIKLSSCFFVSSSIICYPEVYLE